MQGLQWTLRLTLALSFVVVPGESQRMFFSKYVEAGGGKQYLEIYNPCCNYVDMSEWSIVLAKDGAAWNLGSQIWLTGLAAPGGTYKVATEAFNALYATSSDYTLLASIVMPYGMESIVYKLSGSTYSDWFDGNDAVGLLHNGHLVDAIGKEKVGAMSGQSSWTIAGNPMATENIFITRKSSVQEGNFGLWKEGGTTNHYNHSEWDTYTVPATSSDPLLDTLGVHTQDGSLFPCSLMKLTCGATGKTIGHGVGGQTVICPPNCHLKPGYVIGAEGTYDINSYICKAAIHGNVTQLTAIPGAPSAGSAYQTDSFADETARSGAIYNYGVYGQLPAKADIIILAPNGKDTFYNYTDGTSYNDHTWRKMITHINYLTRQFYYYANDEMARVSVMGYSDTVLPASPVWRNAHGSVRSDIWNSLEDINPDDHGNGERIGAALRTACSKLMYYNVETGDHQSPRLDANKFLLLYMRHEPNSTELALMEEYLPCFKKIGFTVMTITNATTGWGNHFDNTVATSNSAHWAFDWKEDYTPNGFGSNALFSWILDTIAGQQMCWNRTYQTSGEKVYISYQAKVMPEQALVSSTHNCVATYNRTHNTLAPSRSPTFSPTESPTYSPTTFAPTGFNCSQCYWVTDLTPAWIPYTSAPTVAPPPTPAPVTYDAFSLSRIPYPSYKTTCHGGNCQGRGSCKYTEGQCECAKGYFGPDCGSKECVPCQNGGDCDYTTGDCRCPFPFKGLGCLERYCSFNLGDPDCYNNGVCNPATGRCESCIKGHRGTFCDKLLCGDSNGCNNRGRCETYTGECVCYKNFYGQYCQYRKCSDECSEFGTCDHYTGRCACDDGTDPATQGGSCRYGACPNDCSGHGVCDHIKRICTCDVGWTLKDCSREIVGLLN